MEQSGAKKSFDPYVLLGLDHDACDAWVRSAFRRASLQVHPDRCPNDPEAADRFRELTEAKDLLLNPLKRRVYDLRHHAKAQQAVREVWWLHWDGLFEEIDTTADESLEERLSQSATWGLHCDGLEDYSPKTVTIPRCVQPAEVAETDILIVGTGLVALLAIALLQRGLWPGRRWSIAGRDDRKLQLLEAKVLSAPGFTGTVLLQNAEDIVTAVRSARVVVNLSGPKCQAGPGVMDCCARLGRHCVDSGCEPSFSRTVKDTLHVRAKGSGASLVMHVGQNSMPNDLGAWMLVRYIRERWGLPTRNLDSYVKIDGFSMGGACYEATCEGNYWPGVVQPGDSPFVLGGVRGTGVRDEERLSKVQPVDHKQLQISCLHGPAVDRLVVRASCGLMDSVQPYGRRFSYNNWIPYRDKMVAQEDIFMGLVITKKLRSLVEENKVPPKGSGPCEQARRRSNLVTIFWGQAEASNQEEPKAAHAVLKFATGSCLGDRYEGTALMCLESACALLDAVDDGRGKSLRPGWGTPSYHLGHLGIAERLKERGMSYKVSDGHPTPELFHNLLDGTFALS